MEFPEEKAPDFAESWAKLQNKLFRYRMILRKRWWVILLTTSLALAGATAWVKNQPARYMSVGRMMVSGKINLPEGVTYSEELSNFFGTQSELMQSGEVRRRATERVQAELPEVQPTVSGEPPVLEVSQLKGASIFVLRVTADDGRYAQAFLNAAMDEYITVKREMRNEKSETTLTAITDELVRLEKELRQGEEELLAFQKTNNIGYLEEEGNSAGAFLAGVNRQLAGLRTEFDLLKLLDVDQNLERIQTQAGKGDGTGVDSSVVSSFGPESEYLKAKQQIELLRAQQRDFAKVLRPAHPTMIQLSEEISKYETLISTFRTQSIEQLKTRKEAIALQIQNLEKSAEEWEAKALDLGQRLAEYNRLKSKLDRSKAVYERLLGSLRNVDVTQKIDQDTVTVLDRATPARNVQPGLIKTLAITLGGGVIVGLAILVLLELVDDRITSYTELQDKFQERILGQVPQQKHEGDLVPVQVHDDRHAFAESFRSLRSSLTYLPVPGEGPKTVVVTSAVPNEGKSTVATNLAVTLAHTGAKVLLVDADVRRGGLHQVLGCAKDPGLGDILKMGVPVEQCIKSTEIPNLHLLPRGMPLQNPGECLLSEATDRLLHAIYADFDFIILDSAPVMVADDTASLAPKVDACLYVVRFCFSSARISRKGLDLLKSRQVNVLGLVCNDVHAAMPEYYYYYQYPDYYGVQTEVDKKGAKAEA